MSRKWSGSLIKSCHGPLKIFSQQQGKEKNIYITNIHEETKQGRALGVEGGQWWSRGEPISQQRLHCGCSLATNSNARQFIIMAAVKGGRGRGCRRASVQSKDANSGERR